MIKENPNCQNSEDDSTDAMHLDGATRSSVEVTVMVMERRGCVKSLALMYNWKQDDILVTTKPFNIPKQLVFQAYKLVRANAGSAGIDNQSIDEFSQDLKGNLYKLWNRMSSGSYFPPPVKEVAIPKKQGGVRKLGIPTVADRIAEMMVKLMMEPLLEPHFLDDSYGYRPNKSALDAIGVTRTRCWAYDWVVEFDIKGLFDNLSHKLLMKAVKHHINDKWILLYVERWLTAPIQDAQGVCLLRTTGTPQGGVITPLLSNLFLHYAFDHWMTRHHPATPWCRYADDGLAHCKDGARKRKYVNKSFDFLGYTFKARRVKVKSRNSFFLGFTPVVSLKALKAMTLKLRRGNWRNNTSLSLQELADFINPMLRGWLAYYGKYSRSSMYRVWRCVNNMLLAWAKKKYKSLGNSRTKAGKLMERIHKEKPALFVHWREGMFGALI